MRRVSFRFVKRLTRYRCLRNLPAHIRRDIGLPPGPARSGLPLHLLW